MDIKKIMKFWIILTVIIFIGLFLPSLTRYLIFMFCLLFGLAGFCVYIIWWLYKESFGSD